MTTTASSSAPDDEAEQVSVTDVTAEFVDALSENDFDGGVDLFTSVYESEFRAEVPNRTPVSLPSAAAGLERYWTALTGQQGQFETISDLSRDGSLSCTAELQCELNPQAIRLTLNQDGAITNLDFPAEYSPPEYVDREAFEDRAVPVSTDGHTVEGTLSMPTDSDGPVPGVLLVHDNFVGAPDQDYTVGPNKVLRDLAWGLASNGVAVYRYSRAGRLRDTPMAEWDIDTLVVNDAVAAAERVADVEGVQSDTVFVAGHGWGGVMVPRIAERHGAVSGGLLLDAPAIPMEELVPMESAELIEADWTTEPEEEFLRERANAVGDLPNRELEDGESLLGRSGAFYDSLLDYDHVDTAARVEIPLLTLQTGRAVPSTRRTSYDRWQSALSEERTRFKFYPAHNPFFQVGTSPAVPMEVVAFHDNLAEEVIGEAVAWLLQVSTVERPHP